MKNRATAFRFRRSQSRAHSSRAVAVCFAAALAAGITGCVKETKPVAMTSHAPLIIDEAMQQRKWPMSVAHFANGETPAGPTGFVLEHNPAAPKWMLAFTDGPLFGVNIAAMPIGYLFTAPWQQVIYPSGVVEPTYNAMPPLSPKPESSRQ
jgi:hypothetical protein